MIKLLRNENSLYVDVIKDEYVKVAEKIFDCESDGRVEFSPWVKPDIKEGFNLGVIVGGSGSGKSTLLNEFGEEIRFNWDKDKAIVSNFETPDDAINKLSAVGLNTIPSWYKPYRVLSNGEQFRADLAMKLVNGAVIDEFTSVVDRNVAKAASVAISKYIKKNNLKDIVLSTCHRDILGWLEPDWVIDTDLGEYHEDFFLNGQKSTLTYIESIKVSGHYLRSITI